MVCGESKSAYGFYTLLSLQHHLNNAPNITRPICVVEFCIATFMADTSYSDYIQPHYTKFQTFDMKLVSGVFILFSPCSFFRMAIWIPVTWLRDEQKSATSCG